MSSAGYIGRAAAQGVLSADEVARLCAEAVESWRPDGRRVLVLVPDHSRTCPVGELFRVLYDQLAHRVRVLDFMVALGTHPPLSQDQIYRRFGITPHEHRQKFAHARFLNHDWCNPAELVEVGRIPAGEIRELTGGLFEMEVPVTLNRRVRECDLLVIIGPVFPHEVVGFSGGNKYLFPGIAGPEIINFFHWLGAVITSPVVIGNLWTPVRRVVDRAAAMLDVERRALCLVVRDGALAGLYAGTPEAAWAAAAELSRRMHICYYERPFHTVLACAPEMYEDLWTAGKCMYKLEPVVADGGRLIIYAPHVREFSVTHGAVIRQIGYHVRDFFLSQWERYCHHPWGVLAHCTHVKGIGTFAGGVERPRIEVLLATAIPEADCRAVNLGFVDHRTIRPVAYANREGEGVLCVPRAGEILYRWKNAPPTLGGGVQGGPAP